MEKTFEEHGLLFRYPADWELSVQQEELEATIVVDSPDAAFWALTLFFDRPPIESVIETALATFEQEYDEIDVYSSDAVLCDCQTIAHDLEFVCVDSITSAYLRGFETRSFTALVLFQAADYEMDNTRLLLDRICRSLVYKNENGSAANGGLGDFAELDRSRND